MIVSNILAGPIIEMAEDFASLINSPFNGQVILSGFLEDQKASVIEKFTQLGFVLLSERSMNGWCCILLNKSSNLESDF
ncbi:MAG: hypothetical protein EB127_14025 [Alphaproteobacteria bacterium]|nr:hypothetical protein [Alphaproteobacteria bacterium]